MDGRTNEHQRNPPRSELDAFLNLVHSLPPEEIARLPVAQLPRNIPTNLLDKMPPESRHAVEQLLFAANNEQLKSQLNFDLKYGPEIAKAVEQSKLPEDAATNKIFSNKVMELYATYKELRESKSSLSLIDRVKELDGLREDVRQQSRMSLRALNLLMGKMEESPEDLDVFEGAITGLRKQLEYLDRRLAIFFQVKIVTAHLEMKQVLQTLQSADRRNLQIHQELELLRQELDRPKIPASYNLQQRPRGFWTALTRLGKKATGVVEKTAPASDPVADKEKEKLQRRIQQLENERKGGEVMISEHNLIDWLDAIVDVSLARLSNEAMEATLRAARITLSSLLQHYCQMQEESAAQIAANPFPRIDPRQSINFVLASERFILDYFANKKQYLSSWLGGTAQDKINDLSVLEKTLLKGSSALATRASKTAISPAPVRTATPSGNT